MYYKYKNGELKLFERVRIMTLFENGNRRNLRKLDNMDRKRKFDPTGGDEVQALGPHTSTLSIQEIQIIFLIDDYKSLQELIKSGQIKDLNKTNYSYTSLLIEACEAKSIECVKVLLANNADVNYQDNTGGNALMSAVESGNIEIINLILFQKELHDQLVYRTLNRCFYIPPSRFESSIEIIKLLISRLPDINRRVNDNMILLNRAAYGGHLGFVRLLLECGADPNVTDYDHYDALYVACMEGRFDVIQLLLEFDSPHKISAKSINNAFFCACDASDIDVVRYLISKGADVNAVDEDDGSLAIDTAIRRNDIPLTKLLIENGFNVNTMHPEYHDLPLLYLACRPHRADLIKLLLDSGADPNIHYNGGNTLLLELVRDTCEKRADYTDLIIIFLNHGANVNGAHERSGETPLMIAGAAANIGLVKLLLEYGADVTQVNIEGKSVLDMGRTRSHARVAELCGQYVDNNRADAKPLLK